MHGSRGRGFGLYMAHEVQRRQRRIAANILRLNTEIKKQQDGLDQWLADEANHRLSYIEEVRRVSRVLRGVVTSLESSPTVEAVEGKLADLRALNRALKQGYVSDLVERAKVHMQAASPLAVTLGIAFAVIGVAVLFAAVSPVMAAVGLSLLIVAGAAALIGSKAVPSVRAHALFQVAKAMDPDLDREAILYGEISDLDKEIALNGFGPSVLR